MIEKNRPVRGRKKVSAGGPKIPVAKQTMASRVRFQHDLDIADALDHKAAGKATGHDGGEEERKINGAGFDGKALHLLEEFHDPGGNPNLGGYVRGDEQDDCTRSCGAKSRRRRRCAG